MKDVIVRGEIVELVKYLILEALVRSGGEANIVIGEGPVKLTTHAKPSSAN